MDSDGNDGTKTAVRKWTEVVKWAAGIKYFVSKVPMNPNQMEHQRQEVHELVAALCGKHDPTDDLGWRKAILAGEILVEIGAHKWDEDQAPHSS
ncbi:hypothetical protein DAPPUDRAFT_279126 [Daphnia pulex]|uniref:Uncharacterized protein n=1 Tax=Daphnia pulex TaxID=6669 RepID=E9I780_DAPPU|nr:hypothetical protein DAPPUDRAFT_279126 [Daphnia pulex]|eukprot:EFX60149.1 hypothetical protein DAPPUDRAFT_279126 [Daphnia pulex]